MIRTTRGRQRHPAGAEEELETHPLHDRRSPYSGHGRSEGPPRRRAEESQGLPGVHPPQDHPAATTVTTTRPSRRSQRVTPAGRGRPPPRGRPRGWSFIGPAYRGDDPRDVPRRRADYRWGMWLWLSLACTDARTSRPAEASAYADALALAEDVGAGLSACTARRRPARADFPRAAPSARKHGPRAAAETRDALAPGLWRDECHFQVAERSADAARCGQAGRFAEDCRMHLWSRQVAGALGPDATPASAVEALTPQAEQAGFAPDDPRPWIATFRLLGARMQPLDRRGCAAIGDGFRADTRRDALRDHYNDRLNHARHPRLPLRRPNLSGALAYVAPDPEFDGQAQRRGWTAP